MSIGPIVHFVLHIELLSFLLKYSKNCCRTPEYPNISGNKKIHPFSSIAGVVDVFLVKVMGALVVDPMFIPVFKGRDFRTVDHT